MSNELKDVKFKLPPPPAAMERSVTSLAYETDEGKQNVRSWMVEIDGDRFEVCYTTTIQVQNANRRKRNRRVIVDQQGYLRKMS